MSAGFTAPVQDWPRTRAADLPATPFADAAETWFWTMAALAARRDGTRSTPSPVKRPCDPDDVMKVLDRLFRRGRITLDHARVLRVWGERGAAPNARHLCEIEDARLWNAAMAQLKWPLYAKGIVA